MIGLNPLRMDGSVRATVGACLASFVMVMAVMAVWGLQLLDDGYYYLQVAWNISRGAGSSFDGIHATNGYHPLWQFLLVPLFWVASKSIASWLAVSIQAAFFAASGFMLGRLVPRTDRGGAAATSAAVFWLFNFWLWGKGAMSGMETGLLLFLFAFSLVSLMRVLENRGGGWQLGILLALTTAARLDSLALVISASVVLALFGRRREALRSLLPTLGYLLVYFPVNLLVFGGMTPVSGYVKGKEGLRLLSSLFSSGDTTILDQFTGNLTSLLTLGGRIPAVIAVLLMAAAAYLWWVIFRKGPLRLKVLISAVTIYGILILGFYSLLYPSVLGAYTYYWLPLLFGSIAVLFSALELLRPPARRITIFSAVAALLVFDAVYAADRLGSYSFSVPAEERPDAAGVDFLNSLEGEILVGSWDAGYLGYNCRHPVVNLDGLVAGWEYQHFLDERGLEAWIRSCGITHLANVDYFSGKRRFIEEELGWYPVFEDTSVMERATSIFSLSPGDLEYSSRELRIFFVYTPGIEPLSGIRPTP